MLKRVIHIFALAEDHPDDYGIGSLSNLLCDEDEPSPCPTEQFYIGEVVEAFDNSDGDPVKIKIIEHLFIPDADGNEATWSSGGESSSGKIYTYIYAVELVS